MYSRKTLKKIYGTTDGILGLTLGDRTNETLWVRNQRRMTTTDALAIDAFYCDAISPTMNLAECAGPDQIGIKRPLFVDLICDGFVDCFDLSDENGKLQKCDEDKARHPLANNCRHREHWYM